MSDPIPREDRIEEDETPANTEETQPSLPPEGFPEELILRRLGRLDTRRALAELCKSVPGLDEVLLPPAIRADALTRRSGSQKIIKSIARRVLNEPAAWRAFRTAIHEQIPSETLAAVEDLSEEKLEGLARAHTTEGLIYAAISGEEEVDPGLIARLIEMWKEENRKAERQAHRDARLSELEGELEKLRRENERLTFAARAADERAASLQRGLEELQSERNDVLSKSRKAEERIAAAEELRERLRGRLSELEDEVEHLNRVLKRERQQYSAAARRLEEMHEELNRVVRERRALEQARFTDESFGNLLMRAVKNEIRAIPDTLEDAARTARLLELMSEVVRARGEFASGGSGEPSGPDEEVGEAPAVRGKAAAPEVSVGARPTLAFRALGGAGEVGGSSHFIDFGSTRVLVDAGIKPDGRGIVAPDFRDLGELDAAIITHAHLDHCGALPLLCQQHPELPIYCTPPSARLIISALNDHAAMGGSLSGGASIRRVQQQLRPVPFGEPVKIGGAEVTLTESGHILGAASVLLRSGSAMAFHTGDICLEDHFSIPSARLPEVKNIDLLIMEATLADRQHQPFSESIRKMIRVINEVTGRGGTVLIPTYALGQAQEIILGLKHHSREFGLDSEAFIYVDGSVVTTSERLYAEQIGYLKPYLHLSDPREIFSSENIRAVSNDDRARERILANPCAIIASPVTMQGGASAFYRRHLQNDPKNAVILPSNAEASYGAFRAGEESGAGWQVERVSFAAHCTQDELVQITERLMPRQVILVHGSRRRINDLAHRLAPNHKIYTPAVGETVRTIL
ncbi:MBL fold metallo-hydrolase [Rubrobacter taiwanensis]|uniref:MBL fold metallo-hydrolase n=1 Tax=Rubrobacter taiwanensis TaxID=185139 RepID=A0A4R1BFD2_9ACTN|nr:MBL fold metallo-hydrolase [Rubrobacter taiwanensis]TCJ15895.1 MBL fold metallo-hydrolase [Rubrobacter taiwanensis]